MRYQSDQHKYYDGQHKAQLSDGERYAEDAGSDDSFDEGDCGEEEIQNGWVITGLIFLSDGAVDGLSCVLIAAEIKRIDICVFVPCQKERLLMLAMDDKL